jgi:hypothetical protein
MEPIALVRSPWSGRAAGADTPGIPSGASREPEEGEAVASPAVEEEVLTHALAGNWIVLTSGIPSTFV